MSFKILFVLQRPFFSPKRLFLKSVLKVRQNERNRNKNNGISKNKKNYLKKVEGLNLSYWLTGINEKRMERFWKVVALLQENSRMSLRKCQKS